MKIAIQGHPFRGKEVIQILESLGGKNTDKLEGTYKTFYYIDDKNEIGDDHEDNFSPIYRLYTLDEFEQEFPFKVGDKVIDYEGDVATITGFAYIEENLGYSLQYENGRGTATPRILTPYKEMKEERNITLTLDKAKEWYKKGGELKEIALQAFTEKELTEVELPKTWEEFCENHMINDSEAYFDTCSTIYSADITYRHTSYDKSMCPSRKSAEAHLAMIQLEQLRDCWRNGWVPNWSDRSEKWCIALCGNELSVSITTIIPRFLTFPTKEMAKEFLKCFRDLIEKAGDLI